MEEEKKKKYMDKTMREKNTPVISFLFSKRWEQRVKAAGGARAVARLKGDKTPSRFTACLMAYGGSLQHHL